jgi:hypothetical protein
MLYLSINSLIDTWVDYTIGIVNNAAMQLSESLFSILLGTYPRGELLSHMVTLCLAFLPNFHPATAPLYILTNDTQGFQSAAFLETQEE